MIHTVMVVVVECLICFFFLIGKNPTRLNNLKLTNHDQLGYVVGLTIMIDSVWLIF